MHIESLLSARLFLVPQVAGEYLYFLSNLSGKLSLYRMKVGGSVPEPLIPPDIALQNPHLIGGASFHVFPALNKILVAVDQDGNEQYQPMVIPLEGGYPQPAFGDQFSGYRVSVAHCETETGLMLLFAESNAEALNVTFEGNLKTGKLTRLAEGMYGYYPDAPSADRSKIMLVEGYTVGDSTLYLWSKGSKKLKTLYGKPLQERAAGEEVPLNGIGGMKFVNKDQGALILCTVFDDLGGLAYLDLARPGELTPVTVSGLEHKGVGEFTGIDHLRGDRYLLVYNIDGCSWVYEAVYKHSQRSMNVERVLVGQGTLANGVLESIKHDKEADRFALSFSTATSPTQIYLLEGKARKLTRQTSEKLLGLPDAHLSMGEDASYISHDGLRVSARLYLPAKKLGFTGPRPVILYIHGGPQGQERPDFAWFSMPLIQFLTMRGFAVFVPNVRGSTGYGQAYTKHVDRDWGGQDMLDHVHAVKKVLPSDKRLDTKRMGVTGRSYGGYMTLMLAFNFPKLWKAAVDMFGPYDLLKFAERVPETWKPYIAMAIADPATKEGRKFLKERSPAATADNLSAPLLVIQGANDPRVVAAESKDLIAKMKKSGKQAEMLLFEDEGHDVLKYANRVTCYNAITDFFVKYLKP